MVMNRICVEMLITIMTLLRLMLKATEGLRGLLCWTCNATIGHFKDSLKWLAYAQLYIHAFQSPKYKSFEERVEACGGGSAPQHQREQDDQ